MTIRCPRITNQTVIDCTVWGRCEGILEYRGADTTCRAAVNGVDADRTHEIWYCPICKSNFSRTYKWELV